MTRRVLPILAMTVLAMLACSLPTGTPTATPAPPTPVPPTDAPSATLAPTATGLPSGSGACTASALADFDVYDRPSHAADIFGVFTTGFPPARISGRTSDGWLGFDPGVAQAANIGVFRLRWMAPGAPVSLDGDCVSVPIEAWVPQPGVCYQMSMGPVEVHSAADPTSTVAHTLMLEEFVAVTGRTSAGWLSVNGDDGNVPGVIGFIAETEMNVNGPCGEIPVLAP